MNDLYYLIFSAHFDRDKGIDCGRLLLEHYHDGWQNIWLVSSSHAGGQARESFHQKYAYIPPAYRLKSTKQYQVSTKPIDLSHVKGVGGNFYQIHPYEVITDRGGVRSDFGIHLDANVPGSLGCIVMDSNRFRSFEMAMTNLRSTGIGSIPLNVVYS